MSKCLVALFGAPEPTGLLDRLRIHGVAVTLLEITPDVEFPTSLPSGVAVVGGPVSPYDDRVLPYGRVGAFLATAVAREVPTLGIGGGAHLLAVALGARPGWPTSAVTPGLHMLRRTAQGADDPLFRHMAPEAQWLEFSYLSLTDLPVGAEVLAVDTEGQAQAARFGPGAWGLQGHPELGAAAVAACIEARPLHPLLDEAALASVERAMPHLDAISASWNPVFDAYAALVASTPAPTG